MWQRGGSLHSVRSRELSQCRDDLELCGVGCSNVTTGSRHPVNASLLFRGGDSVRAEMLAEVGLELIEVFGKVGGALLFGGANVWGLVEERPRPPRASISGSTVIAAKAAHTLLAAWPFPNVDLLLCVSLISSHRTIH